ncbi:hypothetical protein QJS04_geneDACA002028 [Acorus gramineus]|uniref:Neprosin PEP catalytic domain-containing protein n=1 Tax=Acorus gramineus TaxID=55184 RepID=A0AAV9A9M2_ACOGR|nr:hypothetical protein QJS04_geneDACA002028 [Acorus gramineus]
MGFRGEMVIVSLMFFVVLGIEVVAGRTHSSLQESEIDRQLKLLNKPALKTIQTQYGDIFDCVDINKQPALDHPLLANHTIKMKPSSYPVWREEDAPLKNPLSLVMLGKERCPTGTVPIRRTSREELISAQNIQNLNQKRYISSLFTKRGHYHGSSVNITTNNPRVIKYQTSTARVRLWGGSMFEISFIEAGWLVSPRTFGDQRTRFYAYWTSGMRGCYNIFCPGFVQISQTTPVGAVLDPISIYNDTQYQIKVTIFGDKKNQHWWLSLNEETIGYWPMSILVDFQDTAEFVEWGGEATGPANLLSSAMGSGYFPKEGEGIAGKFRNVFILNETLYEAYPLEDVLYTQSTNPACYSVSDRRDWYSFFYYGGPGFC